MNLLADTWTIYECPTCGSLWHRPNEDDGGPILCHHAPSTHEGEPPAAREPITGWKYEMRLKAAQARVAELEEALHQVGHDLDGLCIYLKAGEGDRHTNIGEACGIDACIVCLAESTSEEARGIAWAALKPPAAKGDRAK